MRPSQMFNEMISKKCRIVGTVVKSNSKIVETDTRSIPLTDILTGQKYFPTKIFPYIFHIKPVIFITFS
jgi:hypothetical protein